MYKTILTNKLIEGHEFMGKCGKKKHKIQKITLLSTYPHLRAFKRFAFLYYISLRNAEPSLIFI